MAATRTRSSKQLMRVLSTPSRVANALDWKRSSGGAIATLDVHANRIGVRISQHPNSQAHSSLSSSSSEGRVSQYSLPILTKGRSRITESTKARLSGLVHHHNVCGFVVSWPLQEDTGLMGAACGRTLFAIEELLGDDEPDDALNKSAVFGPNRPLCLWEGSSRSYKPARDAFGRPFSYARTSDKTKHVASREQYHQDESIVAAKVWDDFVQTHWPGSMIESSCEQ